MEFDLRYIYINLESWSYYSGEYEKIWTELAFPFNFSVGVPWKSLPTGEVGRAWKKRRSRNVSSDSLPPCGSMLESVRRVQWDLRAERKERYSSSEIATKDWGGDVRLKAASGFRDAAAWESWWKFPGFSQFIVASGASYGEATTWKDRCLYLLRSSWESQQLPGKPLKFTAPCSVGWGP